MNREEIKQQFSMRIRENYEGFLKDWLSQDAEYLVSYSEEIAATKMLSKELPAVASTESMEYLLQFENPLEVVRDDWMIYDGTDISKELKCTLAAIEANSHLKSTYALSKDRPVSEPSPKTVREFLERYPNETFDMMTPGGYVYLTPEAAKKMLAGESTVGNPGCSGFDMEITAGELLNQTVANANFSNGEWHLLSVESPEQEQSQGGMEVTMCWKS